MSGKPKPQRKYIVNEQVLRQIIKIAVGEGLELARAINGQDAGKTVEIRVSSEGRQGFYETPPWRQPRIEQLAQACEQVKAAIDMAVNQQGTPARAPSVYGADGKPVAYS